MAFEKGHPKVGGRQAGTPNKPRYDVAERLEQAGIDAVDELVKLLPDLDPPSRAKVLMGLLAYVAPKPTGSTEQGAAASGDSQAGVAFLDQEALIRHLPPGVLAEAVRRAKAERASRTEEGGLGGAM